MVDVAKVALAMWQDVVSPAARRDAAKDLGSGEDAAGRWIAIWAGLHDIGKASPAFQLKDDAARDRLSKAGLPCPTRPPDGRHGAITVAVLPGMLAKFGLSQHLADRVATVVGGHHGSFPRSEEVNRLSSSALGKGSWEQARLELVEGLAGLLGLPSEVPTGDLGNAAAMALAGLVSVADWIGSNETFFQRYDERGVSELDLASHTARAEVCARQVLRRPLAWSGGLAPRSGRPSFADLFPDLKPRPVQQEAEALVEGLDGPTLVIVEAPMGEGKTEAAMYLADNATATLGERGCYFALPTQATSNQMFERVRVFLSRRYPGETAQLQLLHGHAALSAEFETLKLNADKVFEFQGICDEQGSQDAPPNIVAAEWFTYRKRGLLSPFGVGTIDQALLAVLQTKHVFVRLFGLSHKTVILDEVHAYDTYMSALLERLLEWLAALGSSVVVLSATLPRERRNRLVNAYAKGLGRGEVALPAVKYPRISWVSKTGQADVRHVAQSTKTVQLEWVDGHLPGTAGETFELGERLQAALAKGGCAAVICNTVGRAQEMYRALKPYFPGQGDDGYPELDLLHARYLFKDREQREKRSLVRFGKPGGKVRRPHRAVLVATQVIEQSLDLDFDLMVTDLAPADLVLQRAGRLHRHQREKRPQGLEAPQVWICQPGESNGVPRFDRGTEAVYDGHVLLRSWLDLKGRASIGVPEDVEGVIEAVYDDRPCPEGAAQEVKVRWAETKDTLAKEMERDREEAANRWLKAPSYNGALWRFAAEQLEEDTPEFHKAHQALTRLSEPTVSLVFLFGTPERAYLDPERLRPVDLGKKPSVAEARELLMRSVAVADKRVVFSLLEQDVPAGWRQSPFLRHYRLATMDVSGMAPVGRYRLLIDREVGLTIAEQ